MKQNFLFLKRIDSMFGVIFFLFQLQSEIPTPNISFIQRKVILWIETLFTIIKVKQSKGSD